MGPPPTVPLSLGQGQSAPDSEEKYRSLKRRFNELEEESNSETHRSAERNVRMREERDQVLQKLQEMEQKGAIHSNGSSTLAPVALTVQSSSSTTQQTLQTPKTRTSFVTILRHAMAEDDTGDDSNATLTSRNLGSQTRRRKEDVRKERQGEDTRNSQRRSSLSAGGSHTGNSPQLHNQTPPAASGSKASDVRIPPSEYNAVSPSQAQFPPSHRSPQPPHRETYRRPAAGGDIEMADGQDPSYSFSRSSSNSQPHGDQPTRENGSDQTPHNDAESSTRRDTRVIRQSRGGRNDGIVIAAVAAATAEAEAAAAASSGRLLLGGNYATSGPPTDVQMSDSTKSTVPTQVSTPSSTLAHALGPTAETSSSKEASATASIPMQTHIQVATSRESIVRVAEAVIAAQNAAKAVGTNLNVDPNLDPSLHSTNSAQLTSKNGNGPSSSANKLPVVNTKATNTTTAASSTATPTSATPTPTSSLSSNPYLSLSTNLLSRTPNAGSTTPIGQPMLMPYLYYPPGTPITPNSPTYPAPYNPYYYLAAPMVPGPNGMYPPPPPANFVPAAQQRPPPEPQKTKPKRLKAHTVTTKSFSIPMVPRDKKGKPMLPLNVGIMTVISLGEVCMREHFHTERYIFPVGYEVTRRYLSTVDPTVEVVYHCTILDGGDGPKFQIIPSDRLDKPIIAGTATGAWSNIVKQANAIRNRQHSNSVSGPDFFGLGQNTIKHLIQELPNTDHLRDYVWQNFVEGGPLGGRHAAVIPALPEEYDASMPIGAYYPKRDPNPDPNVPRGMSHYPQHIIAQAEAQRAQKLAQQQAQQGQQPQGQPVAGPSRSTPSSSSSTPQQGSAPASTAVPVVVTPNVLNIQEYQPPQSAGQSVSQSAEKRATRSSSAATTTSTPSTTSRPARSRATQQQKQQPQQNRPPQPTAPTNGSAAPSISADGTMPTTFAGIMNAYPAPGVATAAAPNPTPTSSG
ncbi:hypothetical protein GALMADRAFT_220922 [Galerina marginata CBS 339.88]|uniref:FYR N-terminal domain-containing protein n=1 Tax=Galerina marginata (strain CBS 339.88) TaxID=685588 RepID=A0A067TIG3_GALM3|nr:hypothetical protein GALMADRAFT_220922 [Galerina marginata CBS 339.88]